MTPAPEQMGTAEVRAMLDRLPDLYFSILKNTHIEQPPGSPALCSFELPVLGKRTTTAPTALQAIRAALLELTDLLTRTPSREWPEGWREPGSSLPAILQGGVPSTDDKSDRFQAKSRKCTVGVTLPVSLKASLQHLAMQQQVSFAEVARRLTALGFEEFDERSYSEGSDELFAMLAEDLRSWLPSEKEQVMLRVDLRLGVRLRSAAKEYRRSASEFGAMCLAHGFAFQTQLAEVEQKVASHRGSAVRKLAPQVGLGAHAALLSGILAGSIRAPRKVLRRLSDVFQSSQRVLSEFFNSAFENRVVPAFKAENGKPQVARTATSWEDAVKSLRLPPEQAKELLELDA